MLPTQAVCGGEKTLADVPDDDYFDACELTDLMGVKAVMALDAKRQPEARLLALLRAKGALETRAGDAVDATEALGGKVVALLFSAQWHTDGRRFAPVLKALYEEINGGACTRLEAATRWHLGLLPRLPSHCPPHALARALPSHGSVPSLTHWSVPSSRTGACPASLACHRVLLRRPSCPSRCGRRQHAAAREAAGDRLCLE